MNYLLDLRKIVGTRPLIACGAGVAIVHTDNKLLMQKRSDNGCWGLIGGMMELGESIDETAKREVFEEVGIILDKIDFFRVYSGRDFYYKYPNGDEVYNVINVFTVRYSEFPEIKIDNKEVKEARFFDFDKLPTNISPPDVKIIEDIIDFYQCFDIKR